MDRQTDIHPLLLSPLLSALSINKVDRQQEVLPRRGWIGLPGRHLAGDHALAKGTYKYFVRTFPNEKTGKNNAVVWDGIRKSESVVTKVVGCRVARCTMAFSLSWDHCLAKLLF